MDLADLKAPFNHYTQSVVSGVARRCWIGWEGSPPQNMNGSQLRELDSIVHFKEPFKRFDSFTNVPPTCTSPHDLQAHNVAYRSAVFDSRYRRTSKYKANLWIHEKQHNSVSSDQKHSRFVLYDTGLRMLAFLGLPRLWYQYLLFGLLLVTEYFYMQ